MRFVLTILICGMVMSPTAACMAGSPSIKLGALYNLTGVFSPIDGAACRGSRLAVKLINENGGVLQRKRLELIVIDSRSDLHKASKDAEELVSKGVAAGLGYCDSDPTLKAAPIFEKNRVPFLTVGATDPELPKQVGQFMFMTPFGDDDQAYAMADFAYETLNAKTAAIWRNESTHFTRLLAKFFKEHYLSLGGTVLDEQSFQEGRKDFSGLIRNLKKLTPQPEALFISGNPGDAVPTVDQLRKAGIKLPILSGDGFDADLLTRLPEPQEANEVYFATHAYRGSERPEVTAFVQAYEKEYGKPPENAFAALGYDAVDLLANAIDRAKSSEPKAVAEALAATKGFKAVTGTISFTRPSRVPIVPVAIVGVENEKYRLMRKWTP